MVAKPSQTPPKGTVPTDTMSVSDVRKDLATSFDRVRKGTARIRVEKSGIPVGAIVSENDLRILEERDRQWARFDEIVAEYREAFKDVPLEEIEAELEQAKRERVAAANDKSE